jgi:hypothetical protein
LRWMWRSLHGLIRPSPASTWIGGRRPDCESCQAGALLSFTWNTASRHDGTLPSDPSVFVKRSDLRSGTLYECRACGHSWYLHGRPAFMHYVPRDRLDLIQSWNQQPITLPPTQRQVLARIGPTPPAGRYGVAQGLTETPCAVRTVQGERFETAMVTTQQHAPVETWRRYRLATDIAEILPSPYTLPLPIRIATAKAKEISMGFAPTGVALPDGRRWALNGRQSFFLEDGVSTTDLVLFRYRPERAGALPIHVEHDDVVHFVADE